MTSHGESTVADAVNESKITLLTQNARKIPTWFDVSSKRTVVDWMPTEVNTDVVRPRPQRRILHQPQPVTTLIDSCFDPVSCGGRSFDRHFHLPHSCR